MPDILVSVSAGLFGLAGAGLLARTLGPWVWRRRPHGFGPARALLVLIPAYQEERTLPGTLASIKEAAKRAGKELRIVVGADSCSDGTEIAALEAGAEVERVYFHSKWKTLEALFRHARDGEWVALVDAGAIWPGTLLTDLSGEFDDDSALAVAPAYYPRKASWSEKLLWRFEAVCKEGENLAGGPVSVHGATIFFRSEALRAAFGRLERYRRTSWLNDDVVLPLAARLALPGGTVRYWCPPDTARRVSDAGLDESGTQFARRRRLVAGNLEWVITLFPASAVASPAAAIVALRRLLRIFWAYWILLLLYGVFFAIFSARDLAMVAAAASALAGALTFALLGKVSLAEAALASLCAPFYLPAVWRGRSQVWS